MTTNTLQINTDILPNIFEELNTRLQVYIVVQKAADEEGNATKSRRYKRIVKQYQDAIKCHQNGKIPPLDELPNPPGFPPMVKVNQLSAQNSPNVSPTPTRSRLNSTNENIEVLKEPFDIDVDVPAPIAAANVAHTDTDMLELPEVPAINITNIIVSPPDEMDYSPDDFANNPQLLLSALKQRLNTYMSVLKTAEQEENSGKARRYKRIIKQYNDAIKLVESGKECCLEELPNPPGFSALVAKLSAPPSPLPTRASPTPVSSGSNIVNSNTTPSKDVGAESKIIMSRADKQTMMLRERQSEYKEAALTAKKLGQMEEAKEFFKIFKGFDRLLKASECGLPVDMTTVPVSPKSKETLNSSFHIVTEADFVEDGDEVDLYTKLENELLSQIKSCINAKNMFRANGDIANANRFEHFILSFKKDLNSVKASNQRGDPLPKFHYENKSFSIMQSFSDLKDNELELNIVQGLNYKVSNPDEVDTYIKYEFPYPSETPPKGKTDLIKNTNNPQYNSKHTFTIHREAKACQRIFKRHGIKLEVYSKGGFFQSDTLLGTVVVKLMPLSTEIMIHDAFDLMSGRRACGGKLEVKIRVREPIMSKKLEQITEKWIILD